MRYDDLELIIRLHRIAAELELEDRPEDSSMLRQAADRINDIVNIERMKKYELSKSMETI